MLRLKGILYNLRMQKLNVENKFHAMDVEDAR